MEQAIKLNVELSESILAPKVAAGIIDFCKSLDVMKFKLRFRKFSNMLLSGNRVSTTLKD
jgi:hypothetical protein